MATELKSLNKNIGLTQFWGGTDRTRCIQITQNKDWQLGVANKGHRLTLTKDEAALLVSDLTEWLAGDLPKEEN